jgi:hypothetical protein
MAQSEAHLQFFVKGNSRTGNKDYLFLAPSLLEVTHGKDKTASHSVYANISPSFCHGQCVLLAQFACYPQAAAYRCKCVSCCPPTVAFSSQPVQRMHFDVLHALVTTLPSEAI